MGKRKLTPEYRNATIGFLEKNTKAIIKAEIETYKETEVSKHGPRAYLFTMHAMGVVDMNWSNKIRPKTIFKEVIRQFKAGIPDKMSEDMLENHDTFGSHISAILCFLPSTALKVDLTKLHELPAELRDRLDNNTLAVEHIVQDSRYSETYKHLISKAINIHYINFYNSRAEIYSVVEHNDEVLDMPFLASVSLGDQSVKSAGEILELEDLIEIE